MPFAPSVPASADPCRSLAAVTGRVRGGNDVGHRPSTAHLRPRPVRGGRWTHPRRVGDGVSVAATGACSARRRSRRPTTGAQEGRLRPRNTMAAGRLERRPDRGQQRAVGRRHYVAGGRSNTGGTSVRVSLPPSIHQSIHPSIHPSVPPSVCGPM